MTTIRFGIDNAVNSDSKVKLSRKLRVCIKHSPEYWNHTCQATIPEYWEAAVLNVPEHLIGPGDIIRIYGTSQDSDLDAIADLISELKSLNLTGTIKIV